MEKLRIMTSSVPFTFVLTCHPETYSQVAHGIEARVSWTDAGALALDYVLKGNIARLRIPPLRPPRRADDLWQHTCFEAFVSVKGKPEYCEFNFSPSGEWAAYSFRRYRDGAPLENADLAPKIAARNADDHLHLHATIHLHRLPMILHNTGLRLGLSAVIEEENGILSYWALKHPPGKPDFHHADGFTLEVEPPEMGNVDAVRIAEKR
jgi:hypothetical protein